MDVAGSGYNCCGENDEQLRAMGLRGDQAGVGAAEVLRTGWWGSW